MNGNQLKQFFNTHYPQDLAYDWDNVGLQIGSSNAPIKGILIALDVTKAVVEEAIDKGCNYIVSHHPLIFKPLKNILTDSYRGQVLETLMKHDINVYVSHTNYDLGHQGMNHVLAQKLDLLSPEILEYTDETYGIGRVGAWAEEKPLDEAIAFIKTRLDIPMARLILHPKHTNKSIKTIAISGGSGASHMFAAKRAGADLYLTGDISYHQAHDMLQMGLSAMDIGHYTEHHFKEALKKELLDSGIEADIHISETEVDPFTFV